MWELAGIFLICLIGGVLQGITGIGFSMIMMSVGTVFLPYGTTVNVNRILGLILAAYALFQWRKHVKWRSAFPVIASSMVFNAIGIEMLSGAEGQTLRKILGIVLLGLVLLTWYIQKKQIQLKISIWQSACFGAAAGFFNGLFGIMGPILAIYYCNTTDSAQDYKGTLNLHFTVLSVWSNLYYLLRNGYSLQEWEMSAVGSVGIILATYAAFHWIKVERKGTVTKGMLLVTTIMAISMVIS